MASITIPWSLIESEVDRGGFRSGFVAVFRKYEGQPTDEKDGANRPVKVTMASFARHFGIEKSVFHRWVQKDAGAAGAPSRAPAVADRYKAESLVRTKPDTVIEAIMSASEGTQDKIFHELKLRRDGEDRSPANRKAAQARVHEAMQPVREAFARTAVELCILGLKDATEQLIEAAAEGTITEEAMGRIDKAHESFVIARHEAAFKMEVGR